VSQTQKFLVGRDFCDSPDSAINSAGPAYISPEFLQKGFLAF